MSAYFVIMLFGIIGFIFSISLFAIEYGKWKRKVLAISKEQKIIRSISFIFMLSVFAGIFFFGLFAFIEMKKTAAFVLLISLVLIFFFVINIFIDLYLTRKNRFFINKKDNPFLKDLNNK